MAKPLIFDTRQEGHGSLGVLPRVPESGYDTLADFYGFQHLTQHGADGAGKGEKYFELFGIELKAGPAVFQPMIALPQSEGYPPSHPMQGVLVWNSWPGAEAIPGNAEGPHYKSVGVHCWSDVTGSCGWGYGGGSHIGTCSTATVMLAMAAISAESDVSFSLAKPEHAAMLMALQENVGYNPLIHDIEDFKEPLARAMAASGNCGVHTFWCNSGGGHVGSDGFDRVGWWDDHITPNPIFRSVTKSGGGGEVPVDGVYLVDLVDGVPVRYMEWTAGQPVGDGEALGLMIDGKVEFYNLWKPGAPE